MIESLLKEKVTAGDVITIDKASGERTSGIGSLALWRGWKAWWLMDAFLLCVQDGSAGWAGPSRGQETTMPWVGRPTRYTGAMHV